jgi:hypothetical protein
VAALALFHRFGDLAHGVSWQSMHRNQLGRVYANVDSPEFEQIERKRFAVLRGGHEANYSACLAGVGVLGKF